MIIYFVLLLRIRAVCCVNAKFDRRGGKQADVNASVGLVLVMWRA